ncbi:MAG: SusC/RagA family TonB-linked outer membrane protein [Prevotellaceae bacterium]|jgi:TonB-linked SusC/RagA family outer membrane protein|nr:SusC/RagA family TonB-linked outer membrane protein [Prevotellaceae bacterium]
MKKKLSVLLAVLLAATGYLQGQSRISGTVTDERNEPLQGASVAVKGKRIVAITDAEGRYSLAVPDDATALVFSFIGYADVEKPIDRATVDAQLSEAAKTLDEVVVTALGQKRARGTLGYSVQEVSGEELNRAPSLNFTGNLSGKVAGLQITSANTLGGSTNVILRGFKSLTQSNQALFVVDGVPVDNSNHSARRGYDVGNAISDVNPYDIESVSVLKGAAAAALYGSRAANGVILINTKKGSSHNRLGVTLSSTTRIGAYDRSTLPVYQREYGQGKGGFYTDSGDLFVQSTIDESNGPAYNPHTLVYTWESLIPGNVNYKKKLPWTPAENSGLGDLFETPYTFINSIVVDKANEQGAFKLGYTNNYEKGGLPNSYLRKHQINFSASYDLSKLITVGASFNYVNEDSKNRNGYSDTGGAAVIITLRQWWANSVNLRHLKEEYFRTQQNVSWNVTPRQPNDVAPSVYQHDNFYWTLYENYNTNIRDRYYGNVFVTLHPVENLEITARATRDHYTQLFETRANVGTAFSNGSYSRYDIGENEDNFEFFASYNKGFGEYWNASLLLGGSIRRGQSTTQYASTTGGLEIPGLFSLRNSKNVSKTTTTPEEKDIRRGVNSVFGSFSIDFQHWATVEATLRRDVSSTLPKGNNTYYYPSVSGNVVFSHFLSGLSWLDIGKVKLNYAEVGNDALPYSLLSAYVPGTPLNGQSVASVDATWKNADLKPERNRSYEFGLEGVLFNRRLSFDITYYHSTTSDQLTFVTPSAASGYTSYYVNGGAIENKGVEVVLGATPVKTKDFEWNVAVNWNKNSNKVLSLYGKQTSYTLATFPTSRYQLVAEVEQPYGIIRGTEYEYKDGKILVGADGYPVLASNKLSNIGNINPDWIGGITNNLRYKNLSLNFLIDFKQGGDVYSADMDFGSSAGLFPETVGTGANGVPVREGGYVFDGVTANGETNTQPVIPAFGSVNGKWAAASYIYDASYIKLREVAITYSLPKKLLTKTHVLHEASFSLVGRNLWIIYKNIPYADPEEGQASGNTSIGYQTGAYPSIRTFAFNINLKF